MSLEAYLLVYRSMDIAKKRSSKASCWKEAVRTDLVLDAIAKKEKHPGGHEGRRC